MGEASDNGPVIGMMGLPGLAPSSLDWRLQAAVGVLVVGAATVLLLIHRDRPLVFAIGVSLLEVGLLIAGRGFVRPLVTAGTVTWVPTFVVILLPTAAGIAILSRRGWWRSAGFTPPSQWRRLRLLWLLGLFLVLPALSLTRGVHVSGQELVPAALYVILATGMEELYYRGIILRATIGYGVVPAVIVSSALFGASHVNNLFASSSIAPVYVLEEVWVGALIGIFLAAIRLRVNAIWPTIAAHAAYDLFSLLVYWVYAFAYLPTGASFFWATLFGTFFAAIGLFLLRAARPELKN
jgi:membrane protease YdiL (CAAX protease family)